MASRCTTVQPTRAVRRMAFTAVRSAQPVLRAQRVVRVQVGSPAGPPASRFSILSYTWCVRCGLWTVKQHARLSCAVLQAELKVGDKMDNYPNYYK